MINVSLSSDVIENSKNNYTINSLDKIGTDLEDMRKEAPIISSVTFHDVHQYIALYSILGIFVVVGAILLLRRFRRAAGDVDSGIGSSSGSQSRNGLYRTHPGPDSDRS
ncbi:unnamed protein product [Pieris brassicae]|nr:unnamed protein product [Pieris brassicae]